MVVLGLLSYFSYSEEQAPRALLQDSSHRFGTVRKGAKVTGTTVLKNNGDADLKVLGMRMSNRGVTLKVPEVTAPGQESNLTFDLETASLMGDVVISITIVTNDPKSRELTFDIKGYVESLIDLEPRPALFLSSFRWQVQEKESNITIVNRDKKPLKVIDLKSEGEQFTANLTTLEEGTRYQLSVKLKPEAPSGRGSGFITIRTEEETIQVPVYTFLMEKVYISPPSAQFGAIEFKELEANPSLWNYLKQSVFIYQYRGQDFQIQIQSPAFLLVEKIPAQGPGAVINIPEQGQTAVFELVISPQKEELKKGKFQDVITVTTNDKDFPVIQIPVTLEVM